MPKITIRRELCRGGQWKLPGGKRGTLADMLEHHISEREGKSVSLDSLAKLRYRSKRGKVTIVYKYRPK